MGYSLSPGNQTGSPSCGTITVNQPTGAQQPIAGVNTDMTAKQRKFSRRSSHRTFRPVVRERRKELLADEADLGAHPLLAAYQKATRDYTQQLTAAASDIQKQLQNAIKPQDARAGKLGLINNTTTDLSTLGWASAGSYYLTFAQLNGRTLSLLNDLPIVNGPSYSGWSNALKTDLAPLIQASDNFLAQLRTYVNTADGANPSDRQRRHFRQRRGS
ncbi:hypothetical protein [Methylosinus sp. PW1]|uniref:hypothetical protein n=1 Tax=Methylosinus sp. PW1 TaxID=107636 RepID=UPI0012EC6A7D|nr:hypothetical protein [Methylosinus sp. PW1]